MTNLETELARYDLLYAVVPISARTTGEWDKNAYHFQASITWADTTITTKYSTGEGVPYQWIAQKGIKHPIHIKMALRHCKGMNGFKPQRTVYEDEQREKVEAYMREKYRPTAQDVLSCLLMEATDEPFSDWCDNLGYSNDSRKAHAIWTQCHETRAKLQAMFRDDFEQLQQLAFES